MYRNTTIVRSCLYIASYIQFDHLALLSFRNMHISQCTVKELSNKDYVNVINVQNPLKL